MVRFQRKVHIAALTVCFLILAICSSAVAEIESTRGALISPEREDFGTDEGQQLHRHDLHHHHPESESVVHAVSEEPLVWHGDAEHASLTQSALKQLLSEVLDLHSDIERNELVTLRFDGLALLETIV